MSLSSIQTFFFFFWSLGPIWDFLVGSVCNRVCPSWHAIRSKSSLQLRVGHKLRASQSPRQTSTGGAAAAAAHVLDEGTCFMKTFEAGSLLIRVLLKGLQTLLGSNHLDPPCHS